MEPGKGDNSRWGRENDIVIHPTFCYELRLKDAKLQAHALPWVRWRGSNRVNNCFTLMHTLVLLEAKSPSCCSWCRGTLCRQGRSSKIVTKISQFFSQSVCVFWRRRLCLVVIYIKRTGWLSCAGESGCSGERTATKWGMLCEMRRHI